MAYTLSTIYIVQCTSLLYTRHKYWLYWISSSIQFISPHPLDFPVELVKRLEGERKSCPSQVNSAQAQFNSVQLQIQFMYCTSVHSVQYKHNMKMKMYDNQCERQVFAPSTTRTTTVTSANSEQLLSIQYWVLCIEDWNR